MKVASTGVSTGRKEALHLYRDILRTSRLFDSTRDQSGRLMGPQLRQSARQEFEAGRFEYNPENIARMLVTGRDCLMRVQEMISRKNAGMPYDDLKSAPPPGQEPDWQRGQSTGGDG